MYTPTTRALTALLLTSLLAGCSGSSSNSPGAPPGPAPGPNPNPNPPTTTDVIKLGAAQSTKYAAVFDAMERDFIRDQQGQGAPLTFEYTLYKDYPTLVEAFFNGEVDIAWNTPLAHARSLMLSNNAVEGPIARDVDIQYSAEVVVRKDSGINTIQDLVGKRFAVGSIESGETNLLPRYFLRQEGLNVDSQCTLVNLSGLVDDQMNAMSTATNVINAVRDRMADAGCVGERSLRAIKADPNSEMKVIWSSPRYTHCIMTTHQGYDANLLAAFKRVLLAEQMSDPIGREVLVNEGNDVDWRDSQNERDQFRGFDALIEATRLFDAPVAKPIPAPGVRPIKLGRVLQLAHREYLETSSDPLGSGSGREMNAIKAYPRYFAREGLRELEVIVYGTQAQLDRAFDAGEVDAAWQSGLAHARAMARHQNQVTALIQRDADVHASGHLIVNRGIAAISSIVGGDFSSLAGKTLVVGDDEVPEISVLPRHYLAGVSLTIRDLDDTREPTSYRRRDGEEHVAEQVRNDGTGGTIGFVSAAFAQRIAAAEGDDQNPLSQLAVIWVSPPDAPWALTGRPGVETAVITALCDGLKMIARQDGAAADPTGAMILDYERCEAFVDGSNSDYSALSAAISQQSIPQ